MVSSLKWFVVCQGVRADISEFEEQVSMGVKQQAARFEVAGVSFRLVLSWRTGHPCRACLSQSGEHVIDEVFVGAEIPLRFSDRTYTLIPGAYYNGNNSERTQLIPAMTADQDWRVEVPAAACAIPILAHWDGRGTLLRGSPFTSAGSSGYFVDQTRAVAGFTVPAMENRRYGHAGWRGNRRLGFRLEPNDALVFEVESVTFPCSTIAELYDTLMHQYRDVRGYGNMASCTLSSDDAAELVVDFFSRVHAVENSRGEPIFLNATLDPEIPYDRTRCPLDWTQIVGWCGGTMVAYPLLKRAGPARERALANIDFLVSGGTTASGLKSPIYDGAAWMEPEHCVGTVWSHVRMASDHLTFLLKAIAFEREQGREYPHWLQDARRGLLALCNLWQREKDFGFYVDIGKPEVEILERGSCAGAFALLAVAQSLLVFPDEGIFRQVFIEAALYYHDTFAAKGHCTGGPLDILRADDCESAAALADALTTGYRVLRLEPLLPMARTAANVFASWVLSYQAPFPWGSTLHGINACGGVLANVQNRHIGPGICTNSARFLHDLGELTGDPFYTNLYQSITTAARNYVCREDGAYLGYERGDGSCPPFMKGMVSEQVNLTDSLNSAGEMWRVSAGWPAASLLLAWAERP